MSEGFLRELSGACEVRFMGWRSRQLSFSFFVSLQDSRISCWLVCLFRPVYSCCRCYSCCCCTSWVVVVWCSFVAVIGIIVTLHIFVIAVGIIIGSTNVSNINITGTFIAIPTLQLFVSRSFTIALIYQQLRSGFLFINSIR